LNIAVAIVGLAFLILIHELGHFLVALAVRMRPRRFYVFFPPPLVKRVRNGIEYGIGMIPLGGYVKIPGMHRPAARDLDAHFGRAVEEAPWLERHLEPLKARLADGRLAEARAELAPVRESLGRAELSEPARKSAERGLSEVDDALSPDAYWRAPAWKRIAVIFAGPATNLAFAVALLAAVFMIGLPVGATTTIDEVSEGSPAAAMGLRPGDVVVAVDGRPTRTFDAVRERINASAGAPITVVVRRDGRRVEVGPARARAEERPLPNGETERVYILGIRPEPERIERAGPLEATRLAAEQTWLVTKAIGAAVGRLVTGSGREEVSSPVGIVQASSEALEVGISQYLGILALISLSLALLNLLPLLPLDGGHIAFSIIERLRGRPIPREAYERVSAVGIAVVLFLFFIGLTNDIGRLSGG
jgi:regulator of sigma E protease